MLARIIRRQRLVRRTIAAAVILGVGLLIVFAAIAPSPDTIQAAWFAFILAFGPGRPLLFSRWTRGVTSKKSPLWRQAAALGEPGDVLSAIDTEVAAGRDVRVIGRIVAWQHKFAPDLVLLTPSWLVQVNWAGLTIVRLDDVLWVFRYSRRGRGVFGLSTRRRGFRVCLGVEKVEEFSFDEPAETDAVLDELLRRRPGVFTGFDEQWRELLSQGGRQLANEANRRQVQWQALDAAGREHWHVELRRALDNGAQFLAPLRRDKIRTALDAADWKSKGRDGPPPDPAAGFQVARILRSEHSHFLGALVALLAGTVLLVLLTIGTYDEKGSTSIRVGSVLTTATVLAVGWGGFAFWFVYRSSALRLGRLLSRRGNAERVIADIDADLLHPATRWVHGHWPQSFRDRHSDFIAMGANWLVHMRPGNAALFRLAELVWVHERVVPKALWIQDDRFRFELAGRLRDGSTVCICADDEADLAELLDELLERRPALLTGWRGDWLALLEAGPAALAGAHDEREREYSALPPEKREAWLDESFDLFQRFVENVE